MKRFYREVAVVETDAGFAVLLDGRPLRTPGRRPLVLPGPSLTEAVAEEWRDQEDEIRPHAMRLTRLANTALDRVAVQPEAVVAETAKYAGTDMLCYRADQPAALVARQAACWQPLLDWASLRFDAPLIAVQGVVPVQQPADSLRAIGNALAALDPLMLTAAADLTVSCGSVVVALAVIFGRMDAAAAIEAALLDEIFQAQRWGEDAEAGQRRRMLAADIAAAARFASLLQCSGRIGPL